MTKICDELGANYQQSLRRLDVLKNNRPWTGVGRLPFYNSMIIDDIHSEIANNYKNGDCTNYTKLRTLIDIDYRNQIDQMTPDERKKYPTNLRKNYVYELSRQLQLNTKKPELEEKDRNRCSTTETVKDFFNVYR